MPGLTLLRRLPRRELTIVTAFALTTAAGCTLACCGGEPIAGEPCSPLVLPAEPAVSLADLERFPGRAAAWAAYEFGVKHRDWLNSRLRFSDMATTGFDDWREEHRWHLSTWDALADAWGQPGADADRRQDACRLRHLERLRTILGREDYRDGRMPPVCPWWRCIRVD